MGRTGETDSGNCCVCVLGPQEIAKKLPLEKKSSDSFYLSSMRQDLNLRPLRP